MKKITHIEKATGTPRKCSVCQQPALYFGFSANKKGAINRSSRTPICSVCVQKVK